VSALSRVGGPRLLDLLRYMGRDCRPNWKESKGPVVIPSRVGGVVHLSEKNYTRVVHGFLGAAIHVNMQRAVGHTVKTILVARSGTSVEWEIECCIK